MEKQKQIERVAKEIIRGVNRQKTRKKKDKILNIDTLCDFGMLGLWTPRQISEVFYNGFKTKGGLNSSQPGLGIFETII